MKRIKIALCEDDITQREFYKALCMEVADANQIDIEIKTFINGDDLLLDLEDPRFYLALDLLLLDINMPGINGIQTAQMARRVGYTGVVVFITATKRYYESAFDVGAFHYITKGEHSYERFEDIILKAVAQAEQKRRDTVTLYNSGEVRQIKVEEIEYIELVKRVTTVYYAGQTFCCTYTLERLEQELARSGFLRVHRSCLVSLEHIARIAYEQVTLRSGAVLPVGRKYYPALKDAVTRLKAYKA